MSLALEIALLVLALSTLLCFVRLLRGPSLPDRAIALDQIGIHVVGLTAVYSIYVKRAVFLDVAVVVALLSFLTSIAFARFIQQGKDL